MILFRLVHMNYAGRYPHSWKVGVSKNFFSNPFKSSSSFLYALMFDITITVSLEKFVSVGFSEKYIFYLGLIACSHKYYALIKQQKHYESAALNLK